VPRIEGLVKDIIPIDQLTLGMPPHLNGRLKQLFPAQQNRFFGPRRFWAWAKPSVKLQIAVGGNRFALIDKWAVADRRIKLLCKQSEISNRVN
jgi:hypothetical protein